MSVQVLGLGDAGPGALAPVSSRGEPRRWPAAAPRSPVLWALLVWGAACIALIHGTGVLTRGDAAASKAGSHLCHKPA